MSSTISLLSLSSHRSRDFLPSAGPNEKDIASFPNQVMVKNEYNEPTGGGPDTSLPGRNREVSSNAPSSDNSQEPASGTPAPVDANDPSSASSSRKVHRTEASASPEPPSKRIKLEEGASPTAKAPPASTEAAPVTTAAPKGAQRSDPAADSAATAATASATSQDAQSPSTTTGAAAPSHPAQQVVKAQVASGGSTVVTAPTDSSHQTCQSSSSGDSLHTAPSSAAGSSQPNSPTVAAAPQSVVPKDPPPTPPPPPAAAAAAAAPLKSTTFAHLNQKYLAELEYMLREFRKLERQLLGAKGAAQLEESAGSRERREKLHSFILHLEDTVRQIEHGCKLESEGKSVVDAGKSAAATHEASKKQLAEQSALSNLTKEKEEEENVQKLEEHILANLLPVKIRLKKQLAAQQGATQNPAGMPARRGSLQPPTAARGKGTFAEAAEKRRKQAEAARLAAQEQQERSERRVSDPTQFGKPLGGGGSSLTRNLHGATLGSSQRAHGHGVGAAQTPEEESERTATGERKILYAGMVPGSSQQKSGLSAAAGVHDMGTTEKKGNRKAAVAIASKPPAAAAPSPARAKAKATVGSKAAAPATTGRLVLQSKPASQKKTPDHRDPNLSEEERRRLRKKRRKRKLLRLARRQERERLKQQNPNSQQGTGAQVTAKTLTTVRKKVALGKSQKKKGPRSVEYICALCSEVYTSTCDYNPWWALAQHDCPKCRKAQIPRIDITSPANAIEYHPALLAHVEDNGGNNNNASSSTNNQAGTQTPAPAANTDIMTAAYDSESDTDLSELSDDDGSLGSLNSEDSESDFQSMTPAEQAEHESFGSDYAGPKLSDKHASRLLILMSHASTCPCGHSLPQHEETCKSVKFMMLHVRDCPGTTSTMDVCPFPWCRQVKHLLHHLVSCKDTETCPICSPKDLPQNFKDLVGLNEHRAQTHRKKMIAAAKKAAMNRSKNSQAAKTASTTTGSSKSSATRKSVPVAPSPAAAGTDGAKKTTDGSAKASAAAATTSPSQVQQDVAAPTQQNEQGAAIAETSPQDTTPDASTLSVPDPTTANSETNPLVKSESTPDLDSVLPTPIAAMKMEEDDVHEVGELLADAADPIQDEEMQDASLSVSETTSPTGSEAASGPSPPVAVKAEDHVTPESDVATANASAVTTDHATSSSPPPVSEPPSSSTTTGIEKTADPVKVS